MMMDLGSVHVELGMVKWIDWLIEPALVLQVLTLSDGNAEGAGAYLSKIHSFSL